MAIDKITDKIIQDANLQAESILKEAQQKVDEILNAAQKDAQIESQKILDKAHSDVQTKKDMALIKMQMQSRQHILEAKRQMLDLVFEDAGKRFRSIEKNTICVFYKNMLLKSIVTGDEDICISECEKEKLGDAFWNDVSVVLKEKGIKFNPNIIIDNSIGQGFQVKGKRSFIDCRTDTIIRLIKEEIEPEVAKVLFE
jgi:V/A-type H+-transporting ATPase subunit E